MPGYKTYQTFDEYFDDQAADKQEIITAMRQLVADAAPELTESSKWGQGIWLAGDLPVVYVHTEDDHAQLGFYGGAFLHDPEKILEGKSKYLRFVKIYSAEDIDEKLLAPLIRQAAKLDYKTRGQQ